MNEKLVQLWTLLSDEEKVVYSKVAKNEMLLIQGKDISSDSKQIKSEPSSNNCNGNKEKLHHQVECLNFNNYFQRRI